MVRSFLRNGGKHYGTGSSGFKTCCDITDAHDPSRGRNAAPPPPDDLLKHIDQLKDWDESLRLRQKAIS